MNGGHAYMRWFELARLYQAWGKYQDSVDAYERAFSLADRLDAEKSAPLNYSACLRDYADALEQAGDKPRAEQKRAKAEVIQKQSPSPDILYYPKKPGQ